MPNRERIKLWVDRLRDPESKQTAGRLADRTPTATSKTTPMCCLGHACQVYHEVTGLGYWQQDKFAAGGDPPESSVLPDAVMEWFGLNEPDPILNVRSASVGPGPLQDGWLAHLPTWRTASYLNDDARLSLSQIAARIEATYLKD